ncbi:CHAT domain-containing protein [Actinoplanes sp. NEAU-A12]|uniref:CHAT domain-containing protein n=1 Tax=Actinoplanes sandaracinus TaxID=3045177 RepID=A0ABT6WWH0_9ACTN|nr:CHAT domain-containing protein [Actinoplanes sandaracinus]MDI6104086.1 CHAT domain-containing protein [Actinoplanes sandaracinus]
MTARTPYDGEIGALRRMAAHGDLEAITSLAATLRERFLYVGDAADLVEAHRLLADTADRIPRTHPARAVVLNNLAPVLRDRFQLTGDRGFLRGALSCTPPPRPTDPPQIAMNRSETLRLMAERDRDLGPLTEAEALQRAALARLADGDPLAADVRESLGELLRLRYHLTRELGVLRDGAHLLRRCVRDTPALHPRHADRLASLGNNLQLTALHTGDEQIRETAIRHLRRALELTPAGTPGRPYRLTDLATALSDRGRHTDDQGALREGAGLLREALEATPPEHGSWGNRVQSFMAATLSLVERTGETALLDEAIAAGERARSHGGWEITVDLLLAGLRRRRFALTGRTADLSEALAALDETAERVPYGDADHVALLGNQGQLRLARYEAGGDPDDLRRAVASLGAAVRASSPDEPLRAECLLAYADVLTLRYAASRDPAVLRAAGAAYQDAASTAGLRPMARALAARSWGRAEADAGRWAHAHDGHALAVRLLPLAVSRRLGRSDLEYGLGRLDGLAADATACALHAGHPETALQLLESARGVLLSQATQGRDDVALLAEQHPELAADIAVLLDRLRPGGPLTGSAADERHELDLRLRARLAQARALPGFANLLGAPEPAELYGCAADGPVVLINASVYRSDALIVRSSGVEVVPLPGLTPQAAEERSAELAAAVEQAGEPGPGERAAQRTVSEILRWLAHTIVDPVLARLAGDGPQPRVWWSPVGPLALLPVHAAAGVRVISSYTPTLRALRRARAQTPAPGPTLVVAMAQTPGAPPLPQAGREAKAVAELTAATVLSGPEATAAAVREALADHPGVHFACHAVADPADPSASRLLLHDHQVRALTVRNIADLDLSGARLAVLSACETSRTTARLPDEALHLTSAFQLAGYPEVVGALWPVNDRIARAVAVDLHEGLCAGSGAAAGLHAAVERCRDAYPGTPTLWAGYVHSGR